MAFNETLKNALLDHAATLIGYVSAHNGPAGATGANEITGGTPAYARKAVTWGTAATSTLNASNQPVFDIPAGETVAEVGFNSAATAGTFYGSGDVTDEVFAGQGTYTSTSIALSLT